MKIPTVPKKPTELLDAEKALADLTARQAELRAAVSAWTTKLARANGDASVMHHAAAEITKIEQNLRQCSIRAAAVRAEIEKLWPAYASEMRAAVASHRRAAAIRILDALTQYNAAVADLKITEDILAVARAAPKKLIILPFVPAAMNAAKDIAAECDRDERAALRLVPSTHFS
jgi:hypothetical protein